MSLVSIAKRAIGTCYHTLVHRVSDAKLCIAMKTSAPSVDELVYNNTNRNPTPFTLDRTNSPYLYMVYNHRKSTQPKQHYTIEDTKLPERSKMYHCDCNSGIDDYLNHVSFETDSTVALHLLHNKALQKLANQLPVIKRTTTTRIHRIDSLLVDLCLVSKMITRELKSQYVSYLHTSISTYDDY
ncbi:DEHA2G19624p [Debaryomyces hansenii CBS767]|uniref:DEHA2G19624p n=1 Tax=Debaryomyces hansenii (strain ATCC 36239 / CBS 767 / BCRC 21394 / JCM 1990 / NBRC 0083 / IGC 2968) TaxID=284592 RepID=Q6BHC5_DEBHA|nr:DEHA2G19624p [Debaryomyces hansenii CBS767]CAG90903.2 DEHA2G19624p [Debaryomyces hansenii CBS767]|eukprot:XP_462396.2 DEHA2G19624p [Debaryomyces hansenii CBS767]